MPVSTRADGDGCDCRDRRSRAQSHNQRRANSGPEHVLGQREDQDDDRAGAGSQSDRDICGCACWLSQVNYRGNLIVHNRNFLETRLAETVIRSIGLWSTLPQRFGPFKARLVNTMTLTKPSKTLLSCHAPKEEWSEITPGERHIIRRSSDETNGAYSMFEVIADYRNGTPMHVHQNEDEHFIILEGREGTLAGLEVKRSTSLPVGPHRVQERALMRGAIFLKLRFGCWCFSPLEESISCSGRRQAAQSRTASYPFWRISGPG